MANKKTSLIMAHLFLGVQISYAQQTPPVQVNDKAPQAAEEFNLQSLPSSSEMLQIASDFHKGSRSLEQLGKSMEHVANIVSEATKVTSGNMAAMSRDFDPFGFKTAFLTIQQQNRIIQEQQETIHKLQQQEIDRLKRELRKQHKKHAHNTKSQP